MNIERLGLGTVQFGVDYGISNKSGRTPSAECGRILAAAQAAGVRVIDTAAEYGISEETLGRLLGQDERWRVVTKTAGEVGPSLERSLERLGRRSVYGLLVHKPEDLLGPSGDETYAGLRRAKDAGSAQRIGASVYTAEQIDALLSRYSLDLIQAPVSVLDQRLISGGQLRRLKEKGVEVHARSVFLQGALLMDPDSLPAPVSEARAHLRRYRAQLREMGLTPVEAALGFALSIPEIDVVVCGVESAAQLEQLLAAARKKADFARLAPFAFDRENVLNPSLWAAR